MMVRLSNNTLANEMEFAVSHLTERIFIRCFQIKLEFVFCEGTGEAGENPSEQGQDQQLRCWV